MTIKIAFWDVVFHLAMLVLAIWTILKSTGYINTPVWLEYGVPMSSFIFGLMGVYHKLNKELNDIRIEMAKMNVKLDHHDKGLDFIRKDLAGIHEDLDSVHKDIGFIKRKVLS